MAKRPHGDVERTQEDLDEEFYAGIAQMRLEAGREMQRWGYRPQIILPLPLILPLSGPAKKLPGAEALAAASFATVVHALRCADHQRVVNASSPAAGAASSSAPAMLDGTASGQDAGTGEAPVPDLNTASGQDAAPRPERDTASDQDAPPHSDRGTASGQVAPAQDADVQAAAPETEECSYWKDNCWWKDRGREQRQRCANWQSPWSGTWSGASWSARGNWQEGRWDSSMDE